MFECSKRFCKFVAFTSAKNIDLWMAGFMARRMATYTAQVYPEVESSWPKILTWVGRPGDIGVPHFQHLSAGILVVCLLQRLDVNPLPHLPAILLGIHTYIYIVPCPLTLTVTTIQTTKKHKKNQVVAPKMIFSSPY